MNLDRSLDSDSIPAMAKASDFPQDADLVVVGAGLAGLAAAAFAARGGARVLLLERGAEPGGRAATHACGPFLFNIGPHALYDGGPAARAFADLGVAFRGRRPPASGGLALHRGALHALPGGFVSLVSTDLLSLSGKLEVARVLGTLGKVDAGLLEGRTLRHWLDFTFRDPVVRGLMEALMRLTSYANAPDRSCAAASVRQLQDGLARGVLYVDGGWTTLVDGLVDAATKAGAVLRRDCRAVAVQQSGAGFHVRTAAGTVRTASVLLAVPPRAAAALLDGPAQATVDAWASAAVPVKAACLDIGVRRLPHPRRLFVVGIDQPLYFSVHSASARLAPEGAATMNLAKYLAPGEHDPKKVEAELEAFADLVQPGWRSEAVEKRYLPSMPVAGDLVPSGRPRATVEVPGSPGLLVAGDWVATEGEASRAMLADAAVASGRDAAGRALAAIARANARANNAEVRAVA